MSERANKKDIDLLAKDVECIRRELDQCITTYVETETSAAKELRNWSVILLGAIAFVAGLFGNQKLDSIDSRVQKTLEDVTERVDKMLGDAAPLRVYPTSTLGEETGTTDANVRLSGGRNNDGGRFYRVEIVARFNLAVDGDAPAEVAGFVIDNLDSVAEILFEDAATFSYEIERSAREHYATFNGKTIIPPGVNAGASYRMTRFFQDCSAAESKFLDLVRRTEETRAITIRPVVLNKDEDTFIKSSSFDLVLVNDSFFQSCDELSEAVRAGSTTEMPTSE